MIGGCAHAVERAQQRYGITLGEPDFAAMVGDIIAALLGERRDALLISHRLEQGREIWLVRIPGGPAVRVIYNPFLAVIVTVLPGDYRLNGDRN